MLSDERLAEIKEANSSRTQGKWYWFGYAKSKEIVLKSFLPNDHGVRHVMSFTRWGMRGAQPVFFDWKERLHKLASELFIIGKKDTANPIIQGIDCADAKFMEDAPEYVTDLLEEVERLRAEVAELKAQQKEMVKA